MDLELVTEGLEEEDTFGAGGYDDDYSFCEGERCGICMDIVVDRGVLDCCQHWFCFPCIDNWATITSLCPLCQNEFQLITCVPVYDTIGSNKAEEDSYSRDNDWCIEGKNNILSFPSYYIDENSVLCLDGDGCKIRSKSATLEEDPILDTSIACDSCDIWYHAFCVGFDAEGNCDNSWLCPRCVFNGSSQKSDQLQALKPMNQQGPEYISNSNEGPPEAFFSGKVLVSIADAGETAVVISMVEGNKWIEESNEKSLSPLKDWTEAKTGSTSDRCFDNSVLEESSRESISREGQKLEFSLPQETSFGLSSNSLVHTDLKTYPPNNEMCSQPGFDQFEVSSKEFLDEPLDNEQLKSSLNLHLGLSGDSSLSVCNTKTNSFEDQEPEDILQNISSENCFITVDKTITNNVEDVVEKTGEKRKRGDCRGGNGAEIKTKSETKVSAKKIKTEGKSQLSHSKDQNDESEPDDPKKIPSAVAASKDGKRCPYKKENSTANIMDIVHGTYRQPSKQPAHTTLDVTKERENIAGFRVKKIMRRAADKESSVQVQNLRKEIREAIRNRSSEELGEKLFNPKLLAAFRAVIAGSVNESKKSPTLVPKAKNALLQKGKVRENLTKKIYGIGGRRKRAWTRDCEIEFWKHRCLKTMKPEKIETLKSVLDLLRKVSDCTETKTRDECGTSSSILSRLYLADTSVFPRKDDIKPLSSLNDTGRLEQSKQSTPKVSIPSPGNCNTQILQKSEVSASTSLASVDNKGNENSMASKGHKASSSKMRPNNCLKEVSVSRLYGSKANSQKSVAGMSEVKSDKRKWALEVLARKMAITGSNAADENQEDNAVLKGNYPLLTQLPVDMRPVLAPSRHNKIPSSIRQAQLYRLTELFLRKANLPVIRRTAETELAVADAVNIEKEIADRSNTKLVYMNLCSQEVLHRSDNKSVRATDLNLSSGSAASTAKSEEESNGLLSDFTADEALKNAGLLSDSPPSSPSNQIDENKDIGFPEGIGREGPENVFEMESHPELDIYGDFEYNLEDDEFNGDGALKVSEQLPERELKIKVVFSTSNPNKSNVALDTKEAIVDLPNVFSCLLESSSDAQSSDVDMTNNYLTQNTSLDGDKELSFAECEELYGPDKEPLIRKFPERASLNPQELIGTSSFPWKKEDYGFNQTEKASESGSGLHLDNTNCVPAVHHPSSENEPKNSRRNKPRKDNISKVDSNKQSDSCHSISKKVEAYVKEHIRPLCKSGVITVEQYRWAVGKTTDKVMKYHSKDKNAYFLIKEGEKVKKLAEQYIEAAQQMGKDQ